MSRNIKILNNHKKKSSRAKQWLLAFIAIVVIGVLVLVFTPWPQRIFLYFFSAPMFMKEGEVTLIRQDNTNVVTINVEIADTPKRRETGLMGRPKMEELQGMFFIFEKEQSLSFWMMNTILSLDMFFADADGTISTIHRSTTPYSPRTYESHRPGKFVLETNAGFADKYNIMEGDRIIWKKSK
jgi:uncharacterized protein